MFTQQPGSGCSGELFHTALFNREAAFTHRACGFQLIGARSTGFSPLAVHIRGAWEQQNTGRAGGRTWASALESGCGCLEREAWCPTLFPTAVISIATKSYLGRKGFTASYSADSLS